MKNPLFLFLLISSLFFFGCDVENVEHADNSNDDDPNSKSISELQEELLDTRWELRSLEVNGFAKFAPEIDTMYYIQFNEDGSITGKSKCNDCGGEYTVKQDGSIEIDASCTEAACGPGKYFGYGNYLLHAESFSFEDGRLHIYGTHNNGEKFTLIHASSESAAPKLAILADPGNFLRSEWPDGYYDIKNVDIAGGTLSLLVGYSGCGYHDFNMVFHDYFFDSTPVMAKAVLSHPNEPCDAYFEEEIELDLTSLRERYQELYCMGENKINISVGENNQQAVQVLYEFDN